MSNTEDFCNPDIQWFCELLKEQMDSDKTCWIEFAVKLYFFSRLTDLAHMFQVVIFEQNGTQEDFSIGFLKFSFSLGM